MKKPKSLRTYYGFLWGIPTYPSEIDVATTEKPAYYQEKCRASTRTEAREKLNRQWAAGCEAALKASIT